MQRSRDLLMALVLLLAPAVLAHEREAALSIDRERSGPVSSCSEFQVRFGGGAAVRAEESLPVAGLRSLAVRGPSKGGIYVSPSPDGRFAVTACKAAAAATDLALITPSLRGNEVSVSGPPDNDRWVTLLIVRTPRGADLEIEGSNGPVSFDDVDARVRVRVANGPLSIDGAAGVFDARTKNGPIRLQGGSGDMTLNAKNGPIIVNLEGTEWKGTLEGRATNGPVTLAVPGGFQSGVLVEGSRHAPMSCRAAACEQARRTWDDDRRRIEFGPGAVVVRLSSENGPVSVR
ncbi:MAG TPA: hypothetical protein VNL91_03575 [Thermoanaerobaculia bacterium]|nr:hypothetical protein [Thermoanaerobaculia bacterium]